MTYADYAYYTETYKGKIIPSSAFEGLSMRASEYIDLITQNQAEAAITTYEMKIKFACCAVAEVMYKHSGSEGKTSESVTGHSVSYDTESIKSLAFKACKSFLWDTGLLYSGV